MHNSREKLRLVSPTIDQSNLIIKSYTIDESFIDANLTSINIVLQEVKSARVKYSQTQPYPAQGSKPKSASQVKKPMTVAKKPDKIGKITSSETSPQKADEAKKKMSVAKKITSWLGQ